MPEPTPQHGESPHQEIAELERLLNEKKQALEAEGKRVEETEVFKETFREKYGEALRPSSQAFPPVPSLPPDEISKHASGLAAKEREEQLEALVALALTKGVRAAADVARHATPWLMDELHDRLQDRYYSYLIQAKKLKAI